MLKILIVSLIALASVSCFSPENEARRPNSSSTPAASPSKSANERDPKPASTENKMPNDKKTGFAANLPAGFSMPQDDVGKRILREYGAMFVAKGVTPPSTVVFTDESQVSAFQSSVRTSSETIGGFTVQLQADAMKALLDAITEARGKGLAIAPRNPDSAKRSYSQTVDNWKSRVVPGLKHWVAKGKIPQSEADRIAGLGPSEQVPEIFRLEAQGMFFSQDLSKTIMYSVAPPGSSQHISMLALDVEQHADSRVREVLADHGWFQTIPSDLPHFTYLGATESELPGLGLRKTESVGREFWVPEI